MGTLLHIIGTAYAATAVWLTVRSFNRARWARWSLAALVAVPVLYVLSLGPVCYLASREILSHEHVTGAYRPLFSVALRNQSVWTALGAYVDFFDGRPALMNAVLEQLFENAAEDIRRSVPYIEPTIMSEPEDSD